MTGTQSKTPLKSFYAKTRNDWRRWLQKHHDKDSSIWLIFYNKRSTTPCVSYAEAVEEALCFGWIDSKPKKRDRESYYLFFARRNPKSNWSRANRERARKLVKEGLMTEAGLAMIALAKKRGTWTALEEVQNSIIPADLEKKLQANKKAFKYFEAFPPSSKRIVLEWILGAKKYETRQKRINETVSLAARNIRANHYRQS